MHDSNGMALAAGVTAGLVMTVSAAFARALGMSSLDLERAIGLGVGTGREWAWFAGFGLHLLASGMLGLAYSAALRRINRSGAWIGAGLGLFHWAMAGVLLGATSVGYYAGAAGSRGVATCLGLHVAFGATFGTLYAVAGPDLISFSGDKYFRDAA